MNIEKLISGVEIIDVKNENKDLDIDRVYYNSKLVKKGGLFVAIEGLLTDGHKYINSAIENGAVALVVTKDIDLDIEIPVYKTKNNRKALAQISCNYFENPSKDMTIVGITASNGKTSTSMMLDKIVETANIKRGLLGTVKYQIGEKEIASKLTTPESLELQEFFSDLKNLGMEMTIMEVSSIAQEMYRVYGTDFDVVCMNNITREHIDQHGTFEKYFEEKSKLIKNAKESSFVVLNISDPYVKTLVGMTKGKVIKYSDREDEEADIYAKDIDLSTGFAEFTLIVKNKLKTMKEDFEPCQFKIKLKVAGYHSMVNAISAIAMAICLGLDKETIIKGMESYRGIERRFQLCYDHEFKILDDHFANAGNINMSLQTLSMMTYNKLHIVYAIRGNRGVTVNGENIDEVVNWKDKLKFDSFIATKSVEVVEDHDVVSKEEEEIFVSKMKDNNIDFELYNELGKALDMALDRIEDGDLLLLAGCQGMDAGVRIILEKIAERHPEKDKKTLFEVIEDRVCGR